MSKDTPFRLGDKVGYKSVLTDTEFFHVGRVRELVPEGIPSCREPMLKLKGKPGVVLASHCTILEAV